VAAPVGVAFLDFPYRELGVAGFVDLSGDVSADMAAIARVLGRSSVDVEAIFSLCSKHLK
jgi:hypothetical protein